MKYLIASGWWSCRKEDDQREALLGDDDIRGTEFHTLWRHCIDTFTKSAGIMVVDSASPLKPTTVKAGEQWVEMDRNFGHATRCEGDYSGYTRAIFVSMMFAFANDFDYWVYIEQDALIFGEKFVENTLNSAPNARIFYGSGKGTPQQIQQSFMIFHRDEIIPFISNYRRIRLSDREMSPEWKFLFAANKLARHLPDAVLSFLASNRPMGPGEWVRRGCVRVLRKFDDFALIPFGYGRSRPIDFSDKNYYFQHGSMDELAEFKARLAP